MKFSPLTLRSSIYLMGLVNATTLPIQGRLIPWELDLSTRQTKISSCTNMALYCCGIQTLLAMQLCFYSEAR